MQLPTLIHLQRFSIHDGEGIRTTVFFKGCPLACAWCHNPESQRAQPELLSDAERCTGCGACATACPARAITITSQGTAQTDRERCGVCGECVRACIQNARESVGERMTVDALFRSLLRDRMFYETSNGGVTLSGGEVMVQDIEYITELVKRLSREEISVNIDTCGDAPYENFQAVLPFVDCFLYDLKAVSPALHLRWTGRDNRRILENLKRLSDDGASINLRLPIIGVNSEDDEVNRMIAFVRQNLRVTQIHLLPYHRAGSDKHQRLGRGNPVLFCPPSAERLEELKEMWQSAGIAPVYIGG